MRVTLLLGMGVPESVAARLYALRRRRARCNGLRPATAAAASATHVFAAFVAAPRRCDSRVTPGNTFAALLWIDDPARSSRCVSFGAACDEEAASWGGWNARPLRENDWTLEQHLDKAALLNGPRLCAPCISSRSAQEAAPGRRGGGDGLGGFEYIVSGVCLVALGRAFGPARHLPAENAASSALRAATRPLGGGRCLVDALQANKPSRASASAPSSAAAARSVMHSATYSRSWSRLSLPAGLQLAARRWL